MADKTELREKWLKDQIADQIRRQKLEQELEDD